jgi:hypothetical protein
MGAVLQGTLIVPILAAYWADRQLPVRVRRACCRLEKN